MSSTNSENKPFNNFYTPENSHFYAANVYQPLHPDAHDFRVLEILPGNDGNIIRCNIIQPFNLDQNYEALSYRAEDPTEIGEIVVNGHPFNAFVTLFAAIKRLRSPEESRLVWIDQICINQSDVVERSSQVQEMRMIYEKAEQVIAWLGPLAGGEIAFNAVRSFYEKYRRKEDQFKDTLLIHRALRTGERIAIVQQISDEYLEELELADQTDHNEHLITGKALAQLFESEFWTRAWIWQEIIVAKSVGIFWDTKSMDSEPFFTTAHIMTLAGSRFFSRQLPILQNIFRPSKSRSMVHLISIVGSLRRAWRSKSLLNIKYLLRKIRHAQSSDVRDRIYAIYGLIPLGYQITLDYTRTPDSVYCLTTWSIISRDRSLDILALCGHPTRVPSVVLLPSWCPDWSTGSLLPREPLIEDASGSGHREVRQIRFQTSKKLAASCHMHNDTGTQGFALLVKGLHVDQVEEVHAKPLNCESSDIIYEDLLESCSQLISRKKILTEDLKIEVDRTLTVDNGGRKDSGGWHSSYKYARQRQKLDVVEGSRLFFTSQTGLMGMAPPHVKAGDLICVLFGATVPFLLRRTGPFYILIGEVYISDGYMEGRAIDEMEAGTRSPEWVEIH